MIMCGGAAVPRSLIEAYEQRFGVRVVQGWGLTETSPVASLSFPPKHGPAGSAIDYRATAGRPLGGVEARVVDDEGKVLPRDGQATGEIEVRGPWVTAGYYKDPAPDKFRDGWLRTGDVGRIDAHGYITISDRAKDVVKSGGEWISTLELESAILTHPAVREVAVIAAPDERWGERPLACITLRTGPVGDPGGAPGPPGRPGGQVVAARAVGVPGRGTPHQRRQARQEAAARAPRRRRPRRRDVVRNHRGTPSEVSRIIWRVCYVRSRYRRHRPDADRPRRQGLPHRRAARRPGRLRRGRGAQADPAAGPRPDRRRDLRLRPARWRARPQPGPDHQHPGRGRRPGHHGQPLLRVVAAGRPDGLPRHQGGRGLGVRLRRRRVEHPLAARRVRGPAGNPEPPAVRRERGGAARRLHERWA